MKHTRIQISDVVYNAASQSFEALVSIDTGTGLCRYPCAIDAPISMNFTNAAIGLKTQALRRHIAGTGLLSRMHHRVADVRAGRPRFSARAWLAQLGIGTADKAA
jgi:hypothetical protein